mgnify:CR=1 FL=1
MKQSFQLSLAALVFILAGCAPVTQNFPSTSTSSIPVSTLTSRFISTQTATYDPNDVPPEWLFTPTPDPNAFTISAKIEPGLSQEDIARILFSKWLNHFKNEKISLVMRLDEFVIDQVTIPSDQKCAEKLGGALVVDAHVTLKTSLPLHANNYEHSDWVSGSGNIIDDHHITKPLSAIVYQDNNNYTLLVVMQIPMCNNL